MTQTQKLTEVIIARADTPTKKTNRVYSRRILQEVVKDARTRGILYCSPQPSPDGCIVVNDISHCADNFRLIRGDLLCDITSLKTPAGLELPDLSDKHFHIYGLGQIDDSTGEITAYQLLGVGMYDYEIY